MLAFDPRERPTAARALEQVRGLLPVGSAKASEAAGSRATPTLILAPAQQSARAKAGVNPMATRIVEPGPAAETSEGKQANVGARVVVVDRLGLDWIGIVVGLDAKRTGNVLVKHESTRGSENIRSYPLNQVVRGAPLK